MAAKADHESGEGWHIIATAQLEEEVSRMAFVRWQEHLCIRKVGMSTYEVAYCEEKRGRLVSTGALHLLVKAGWFETLELLGDAPERIKAFIQSCND